MATVTGRSSLSMIPSEKGKEMSQNTSAPMAGPVSGPLGGRWLQLLIGVICMSMIANLQYGWTLFVEPMNEKHQWGRAAIQVAFTIFVVFETWLVPVEGWFVDKARRSWCSSAPSCAA